MSEYLYFSIDVLFSDLQQVVTEAFQTFHHNDVVPVVRVGKVHVAELFHGETMVSSPLEFDALPILARICQFCC